MIAAGLIVEVVAPTVADLAPVGHDLVRRSQRT